VSITIIKQFRATRSTGRKYFLGGGAATLKPLPTHGCPQNFFAGEGHCGAEMPKASRMNQRCEIEVL